MSLLYVILLIVWLHFLADFIMQSDKIAIAKSTSDRALIQHVLIYQVPFLIFGPTYALINGVLHYATDYVSSRMTTYFWKKEKRHWFFVTIGADQALHLTALFGTYFWLFCRH